LNDIRRIDPPTQGLIHPQLDDAAEIFSVHFDQAIQGSFISLANRLEQLFRSRRFIAGYQLKTSQ